MPTETNTFIGARTLAIPGPTNMPPAIRQAMDTVLEDHRAPDFPEFIKPLLADLKKIFRTETGHVFAFTASGTGGWEAAIGNTLSAGDEVLTASFGQFSMLWANMCKAFGLVTHNTEVEWGQGVPLDQWRAILEKDTAHKIKAVLLCHNETATGVCNSVQAVREILDTLGHPAMLFVDGVSSIGSVDFRMDEWGVDVAVAGSQKGFMLPAGLAIVAVSRKAMTATATATLPRCYFDFPAMLAANETGYYPYTPATSLLRGLRVSVDMLLAEGHAAIAARHRHLANGVRHAVEVWGSRDGSLRNCCVDAQWYSDTVTAIYVEDNARADANTIIKTAYDRYGVSLGGGLGAVAGKVFRIGHLGWLNEAMVMQTLGAVEATLHSLDMNIESGVAAAAEYYGGKVSREAPGIAAE